MKIGQHVSWFLKIKMQIVLVYMEPTYFKQNVLQFCKVIVQGVEKSIQ
jgi:hypothetical protein